MINYSSNCNTEFLQDLLGLETLDKLAVSLDVNIDKEFYLASSLLTFSNWSNLDYNNWIGEVDNYT